MPAKTYKRKVNKRKTRKNKKHSKNRKGGWDADTTARYEDCKGKTDYASIEACNKRNDANYQQKYARDYLQQRETEGLPIRSVADRQREEVFRAKYPISSRLGLKTMTNPNEPYNSKRGYFW